MQARREGREGRRKGDGETGRTGEFREANAPAFRPGLENITAQSLCRVLTHKKQTREKGRMGEGKKGGKGEGES